MNPDDQAKPPAERADPGPPGLPEIDVFERGGRHEGVQRRINQRLYMQLLVFEVERESVENTANSLIEALANGGVGAVVYADVNHPRGLGVLTWSEDPEHFVRAVRPVLGALHALKLRPEFTMLGRTYSLGYEPQLEDAILERPRRAINHEDSAWAIWYPLRRNGAFAQLSHQEQSGILREHATIGMAYGKQDLAHDVRLACHGLDAADNEFVIGLLGSELHPLSHCVQSMRKTRQTAEFIAQMGPFFVGHVLGRTPESRMAPLAP
ncbi:MAG: chlorite dismutase family protein [Deltaproteobacteria bacterium]|nr:chlorite dismutase family protein [Deltaproteobacteria bacterium]